MMRGMADDRGTTAETGRIAADQPGAPEVDPSLRTAAEVAADLGVDPATVGAGAARTEVLAARPRPERANRRVIVDDGTAGAALAAFLVDNQLA